MPLPLLPIAATVLTKIPMKYVLAGIGACAILFGIWWVQDTIRDLEKNNAILKSNNEQLINTNRENLNTINNLTKITENGISSINTKLEKDKVVTDRTNEILDAIHKSKPPVADEKACPPYPIFDDTLSRLWGTAGSKSGN